MLRIAIVSLLLATLTFPAVSAAHVGPCTHEYVDAVARFYGDYRQHGLSYAVSNFGTLTNCVTNPCGGNPTCERILESISWSFIA